MTTEWIITSAKINENGSSMEVSFRAVHGASRMTNTLDADAWQQALHVEWLLKKEKELTASLASRVDELYLENRGLRSSLVVSIPAPTKGE